MTGLTLGLDLVVKAFTDQEAIELNMRAAWLVFLAYNIFDTIQIMGSSVMRAALKMGWGTIFNFIGYFICGLPLSWYCAFKLEMGIAGIWIGPTFAAAFLSITYNMMIASVDWRELINTIEERTRQENEMKEKLKSDQV